jgi:tetratricopeptide (TPR) repeat protein
MFRRIVRAVVSESISAHLARFLAIAIGFVGLLGLSDFKDFFETAFGPSLQIKLLTIMTLFFASEWVVSWRNLQEKDDRLKEFQSQLLVAERTIQSNNTDKTAHTPEVAFIAGITEYVRDLSNRGRDHHVLRLRHALSRHLWVEGLLRARIALGEAAEKSAAKLGAEQEQMAALIDDLGWTLVATEDYQRATEKIAHGLRIAERTDSQYWIAKAHRHLSGIAAIRRDFQSVEQHMTTSEIAAKRIPDSRERSEMIAGIAYARAVALMFEGRFKDALTMADTSADERRTVGDPTRVVRSFALKGKILLKIGDSASRSEAKSMFLRGLEDSERIGRRDEIIRNLNGLAVVAELDKDTALASEYRDRARKFTLETPVPYELIDQA